MYFLSLQLTAMIMMTVMLDSSVSADADSNFNFGGEPKFCPPYRCPKGQEPVPKWPLRIKSTGCQLGGGMSMLSPGKVGEEDVHEQCCDLRHACLQTCGSIKTHCNEEFKKCSDAVCASINDEEKKKKCESSSQINNLMIQMDSNCQQFDSFQYANCECVESGDKAVEKRERILRSFYKKFKPESVDKVPGLMKKIEGNKRKMVGLLLALYKKFPQAITKVKDPQQEMMEQMMKESREKAEEEEEVEESDAEDLGTEEL